MRIKIILLLALYLFFQNPVTAEAGVGEKVIGMSIKTVVRIVVATTNLKKVKKRLVNKLESAKDEEFDVRYAKFYELIKDLPEDLKTTYRVTPYMTKGQMIKNIESVDKKEIYRIIKRIPDKTVTGLFKEYLRER